ncbi:MAG: NTP transferase domain-containing protein [Candidatus Cloacimonetes bacterium]|nr:NTP transferase domain-containing protein [Candidatus Cloacimonadota bacterium]MCF7814479.1 NTP transferase domain-containing protein [Candidatus Cloacimonadota bacterium]MCF7867871.1 NTP transferase domain-containing protein [Candidatus Cloacimonadota bacterium]MCF7883690.1 NTP transferase domain-containing protein [Candidatus Cloacimonadota bacterium]
MIDNETLTFIQKQKAPLSSVIICAGRSSRMGQEKALLKIRNYTVLSLIVNSLNEYSETIAIVLNAHNHKMIRESLIESDIEWQGVHFAINKNAEKGMFTSIKQGLESAVKEKPTLLHLIDQPFIKDETYDALENSLDDDHLIFQPSVKINGKFRAGHPIIFQPEFRDFLLKQPDDTNLKEVLKRFQDKIKYVEVDDEAILHNINTMEEFEAKLKEI